MSRVIGWPLWSESERKMITMTLEVPDDVVLRIERRASARGVTLNQQVIELHDASTSEDRESDRTMAVQRMNELFAQVSGFRSEPLISREDLY
ncbi:MAG: hypothetical protein WCH39_17570, partial [Schlesneria sp.]